MKKISTFPMIMLFMFIFTGVKAELPALTNGYPSVSLPYTFSTSNTGGYIDLDGDEVNDYLVTFSDNSGTAICLMQGIGTSTFSSGGNLILTEFVPILPPPSASAELGAGGGPSFCSILQKGEMVGPDELYTEAVWYPFSSTIMYTGDFSGPTANLGANSYEDGLYSGYLGTYFSGSAGWYYGWVNVEIDPSGNWVTLKSSGIGTAPATPVPAGLGDPYAVPVPLIASILGFGLIGGGAFLRRKKKANR